MDIEAKREQKYLVGQTRKEIDGLQEILDAKLEAADDRVEAARGRRWPLRWIAEYRAKNARDEIGHDKAILDKATKQLKKKDYEPAQETLEPVVRELRPSLGRRVWNTWSSIPGTERADRLDRQAVTASRLERYPAKIVELGDQIKANKEELALAA